MNSQLSVYFPNPNGTAPGIAIIKDGKCAILLPGPPNEMEAMFKACVQDFLQPWTDGAVVSHNVRTMGIGESAMAEIISDLMEGDNPSVAPYASRGEAFVRVTAKAANTREADVLIAPVLEQLNDRLRKHVYGVDVPNIETVLVEKLTALGKTLSTAESITGGAIAKRLTNCPGAGNVLRGSIVAYCDEIKQRLLDVKAKTVEKYTAVSEECAAEMANNVRTKLGTDYALASTGYADGNEQLCAYIALSSENGVEVQKVKFAIADRQSNRLMAVNTAFYLLWQNINR